MYCHYYRIKQWNPVRFECCGRDADALIVLRDKTTWEETNMPVCKVCLKTLENDREYEILRKTLVEG